MLFSQIQKGVLSFQALESEIWRYDCTGNRLAFKIRPESEYSLSLKCRAVLHSRLPPPTPPPHPIHRCHVRPPSAASLKRRQARDPVLQNTSSSSGPCMQYCLTFMGRNSAEARFMCLTPFKFERYFDFQYHQCQEKSH